MSAPHGRALLAVWANIIVVSPTVHYNDRAMTRTIVTPLLLLTIATAILRGQEQQPKPNLSGTWIFNAQKSSLKVPVPSSMTMRITHKDPQIRLARTQVYGDKTFEWKLEAVTDDKKEVVQKSLGRL
jgi:hypothetical protein